MYFIRSLFGAVSLTHVCRILVHLLFQEILVRNELLLACSLNFNAIVVILFYGFGPSIHERLVCFRFTVPFQFLLADLLIKDILDLFMLFPVMSLLVDVLKK